MKTIAKYLVVIFSFLFLNTSAQWPGDSKGLETKHSKGRLEQGREEKKVRKEKHKIKKAQRKSVRDFIMGGHKERKEQRNNRIEKRRLKKRERKAEKESVNNIKTDSLYKRVKKHHRKKKPAGE